MTLKELARPVGRGLIAGALATQIMERVAQALYQAEPEAVQKREEQVREEPPFKVATRQMVGFFEDEPREEHVKRLAPAIHWALGLGAGAAYALAAKRFPQIRAGRGLAFGAAFFLVVDEGMNSLFGWTPPPQRFPWQAHARGLVAHLVFGLAADAVLTTCEADVSSPHLGPAT